ncbi:MAG: Uma2 family endonuclease, partial [Acidobacteriota bacterium]|nr:Uma2 family endonuclease [Acidobacteriota bacterium]
MVAAMREMPRRLYSLEEYFALEGVGEVRYEYWDGEIVCISGGSRQHATASSNLHFRLSQRLQGKNCRAFTGELQIKTPILLPYRYPDVSVVCGKPEFDKIAGFDVLVNPILVVEVLSPGTAHLDRKEKREAYQGVPSLMEYLLVSQDAPHITQYSRQPDGQWLRQDYGGLLTVITLPSIECTLAMSEVYDG